MRQGVINRACKASMPLSNETAQANKKQWLEDCTAEMDAGLLRQFLRAYYSISVTKIEELDAKNQVLQGEGPESKRQRTGDPATFGGFVSRSGGFGSSSTNARNLFGSGSTMGSNPFESI